MKEGFLKLDKQTGEITNAFGEVVYVRRRRRRPRSLRISFHRDGDLRADVA
jgi:hypothetical protein